MDFIYVFYRYWKLADKKHFKICIYVLLNTISVLAVTMQPLAFSMVINTLQKQNKDMLTHVTMWLGVYVLCFYIFEICHRMARGIEISVAYHSKKKFVLDTYLFLQSLPLGWHVNHHSGNVISRVNKASDAFLNFGQSSYDYITIFVQFFTSIVILWLISPVISIASILTGGLIIFITRIFYRKTIPEYRKLNEGFHEIAGIVQDGISNISTIIILRLGKCVYKDIEKKFDANFCHAMTENKYTQFKCHFNSLFEIVLNVGLIFFYIFSAAKSGEVIMLGFITAIFQYLSKVIESFWFYASDYEKCMHWRADIEAVDKIFTDVSDSSSIKKEFINPNWKRIKVHVSDFCFETGKAALCQADIRLERQKKIAFVGESGSGKSTLLKILRGIYQAEYGFIFADDEKQKQQITSLMDITTLIPQEPEMFDHSLLYNIVMGLEYTEEELQQAIYLSGLDEVLPKLPNGIYSQISEDGVNLSGGEKQRLALARGIFSIKDSSIVLLDEPTASLDAETELKVYQRIFGKFTDKCIISVLHRLHLLYLFDYIYVFKDGNIVEQGTLEELKKQGGYFGELWDKYMRAI